MVITARVRSTTGRYCFYRCLSVHGGEGGSGYPPRGGTWPGTPPPPPGGYPDPPPGGTRTPPGGTWPGTPPGGTRTPGGYLTRYPPRGVVPRPPLGGYLTGYPPWQSFRGGYPDPPWGGYLTGYPPRGGTQLGQHSEYLLHSGRYASCVHAGGLSCYYFNCFLWGPIDLPSFFKWKKDKKIAVLPTAEKAKYLCIGEQLFVDNYVVCGWKVVYNFGYCRLSWQFRALKCRYVFCKAYWYLSQRTTSCETRWLNSKKAENKTWQSGTIRAIDVRRSFWYRNISFRVHSINI